MTDKKQQHKPPGNADIAALQAKHGITSGGRGIKEFSNVADFVHEALALWGAAQRDSAAVAPNLWDRAIAQEERACRAEDALIDLVNQIRKTSPIDDHGHKLTMNRAYLKAVELLDASAAQQEDPSAHKAETAAVAGPSKHYDEVRATLTGLRNFCESLSEMQRCGVPLGSHGRGYAREIAAALLHLEALYAAPTTQAPQPVEPAATVIKRGASREWMSERLGHLPDGTYSLYLRPVEPAVSQALAALKSCRTGGYRDVDGDYAKTWWFDEALVKAALAALAQPQEAAPSQDAEDAARYRWLLSNYARGDGFDRIDEALNDGEADVYLSAAIDAARALTQAKEGGEHA